jgi:hypothetical protein
MSLRLRAASGAPVRIRVSISLSSSCLDSSPYSRAGAVMSSTGSIQRHSKPRGRPGGCGRRRPGPGCRGTGETGKPPSPACPPARFPGSGQEKPASSILADGVLGAQHWRLDELLHRRFHGAQHQRRGAHAHHLQRAHGLVQLLARGAQLARVQGAEVGVLPASASRTKRLRALDAPSSDLRNSSSTQARGPRSSRVRSSSAGDEFRSCTCIGGRIGEGLKFESWKAWIWRQTLRLKTPSSNCRRAGRSLSASLPNQKGKIRMVYPGPTGGAAGATDRRRPPEMRDARYWLIAAGPALSLLFWLARARSCGGALLAAITTGTAGRQPWLQTLYQIHYPPHHRPRQAP